MAEEKTVFPEGMPLVSVIVPTFNREHCLERALKSVQMQDYANWEFIVADDASTDGTYELAEKLAHSEPRVRVLPRAERNQGAAAARNRAMTAAQGKYLALLDSDDEWLPGKLTRQVAAMEAADESVGICFTGAKILKNGGPRFALDIPRKEWEKDPLAYIAIGHLPFTTSTTMLKRECFENVGGMELALRRGQDAEFFMRIFFNGFGLITIQDVYTVMNLETRKSRLYDKACQRQKFLMDRYYQPIKERRGTGLARRFASQLCPDVADRALRERHYIGAFCELWKSMFYHPANSFGSFKRDVKAFLCGILPFL